MRIFINQLCQSVFASEPAVNDWVQSGDIEFRTAKIFGDCVIFWDLPATKWHYNDFFFRLRWTGLTNLSQTGTFSFENKAKQMKWPNRMKINNQMWLSVEILFIVLSQLISITMGKTVARVPCSLNYDIYSLYKQRFILVSHWINRKKTREWINRLQMIISNATVVCHRINHWLLSMPFNPSIRIINANTQHQQQQNGIIYVFCPQHQCLLLHFFLSSIFGRRHSLVSKIQYLTRSDWKRSYTIKLIVLAEICHWFH